MMPGCQCIQTEPLSGEELEKSFTKIEAKCKKNWRILDQRYVSLYLDYLKRSLMDLSKRLPALTMVAYLKDVLNGMTPRDKSKVPEFEKFILDGYILSKEIQRGGTYIYPVYLKKEMVKRGDSNILISQYSFSLDGTGRAFRSYDELFDYINPGYFEYYTLQRYYEIKDIKFCKVRGSAAMKNKYVEVLLEMAKTKRVTDRALLRIFILSRARNRYLGQRISPLRLSPLFRNPTMVPMNWDQSNELISMYKGSKSRRRRR